MPSLSALTKGKIQVKNIRKNPGRIRNRIRIRNYYKSRIQIRKRKKNSGSTILTVTGSWKDNSTVVKKTHLKDVTRQGRILARMFWKAVQKIITWSYLSHFLSIHLLFSQRLTKNQCRGSGSGAFLTPGSGMKRNRTQDKHPDPQHCKKLR